MEYIENIKHLKMSECLKRYGVLLLNSKAFENPGDISKENVILYSGNTETLLDLNESIIRFNLPEAHDYWIFMDVAKIDSLEIKTEDDDTAYILYFMCGKREHSMSVTEDELEEIYKKLRELNRYDILIKCQG
jgi:hypothetical protein